MKNNKKVLFLSFICMISLMLVGCKTKTQAQTDNINLRISQASAANGAIGISMEKFAERIEEKSGGKITISTFHNGQLGTERDNVEAVQLGNIDIAVVNQSVLGSFYSDLQVLDLPYIIRDYEHADQVFLGEIGNAFLDEMSNIGLEGLSIWESGFRNLTNSVKDVETPADVEGLRIRVMENRMHQQLWNQMGADPVPMSWSDAYTGLQQGAIDGQENPTTVIDKNNVVEVNKRMTKTEHNYSTVFLIGSPRTWSRLTDENKALINEVLREIEIEERELSRSMEKEAELSLEEAGMNIVNPEKELFINATSPVISEYSDQYSEIIEKIENEK